MLEMYFYLLFPLSLVGAFYTIWICSRFFEAFGFQYWLPLFPMIFIVLPLLMSLVQRE